MKPIDASESARRWRFASPHDTFVNHDQALRIARRRWKRNRSKHLRRTAKRRITTDLKEDYDEAAWRI